VPDLLWPQRDPVWFCHLWRRVAFCVPAVIFCGSCGKVVVWSSVGFPWGFLCSTPTAFCSAAGAGAAAL
jgi:hypothetical protein